MFEIKFTRTTHPARHLADAELHFTDGPLKGLKLIGFSIWQRGGRHPFEAAEGDPTHCKVCDADQRWHARADVNVTLPARQFAINGERRSFALLRPLDGDEHKHAQTDLRDRICEAYEQWASASEPAEARS